MNELEAREISTSIFGTSLSPLADDLLRRAIRYAHLRAEWFLADLDARKAMDATRTRAHDAFIDACNILSREMNKAGEDNGWRRALGYDRQVIGDFACYLHCFIAIEAR